METWTWAECKHNSFCFFMPFIFYLFEKTQLCNSRVRFNENWNLHEKITITQYGMNIHLNFTFYNRNKNTSREGKWAEIWTSKQISSVQFYDFWFSYFTIWACIDDEKVARSRFKRFRNEIGVKLRNFSKNILVNFSQPQHNEFNYIFLKLFASWIICKVCFSSTHETSKKNYRTLMISILILACEDSEVVDRLFTTLIRKSVVGEDSMVLQVQVWVGRNVKKSFEYKCRNLHMQRIFYFKLII